MDSFDFLIRIVHILHSLHKPGIAQGKRILQRNGLSALQREDEILGIQHVQHRKIQRVQLFHLSTCISYGLEQTVHFARNMFFYHFLITAELGGMIAPDALVPIGGIVFVECVRCQIQDTIIQCLVLQNHLVGFGLLKTLCLYLFVHKLVVIKVTLVHVPHIYQTKYCQSSYQNMLFQLAHTIRPHQPGTCQDDEETAPSIGSEQTHAHLFQIGKQRHQLVGRDALQSIHFHGRDIRREEQLRQYGKQKCQTARQPEANQKILLAFLDYIRDSHHLLQCQHS